MPSGRLRRAVLQETKSCRSPDGVAGGGRFKGGGPVGKPSDDLDGTSLSDLLAGVVGDCGKLLGQQADLLREEVGQELRKAGGAGLEMAAGGGLVAAGGLLSGLALAHLLHKATGLPMWCCYGGAAGACGLAAAALLRSGARGLADVQLLPPPETAAALGENVAWLKEQMKPETE